MVKPESERLLAGALRGDVDALRVLETSSLARDTVAAACLVELTAKNARPIEGRIDELLGRLDPTMDDYDLSESLGFLELGGFLDGSPEVLRKCLTRRSRLGPADETVALANEVARGWLEVLEGQSRPASELQSLERAAAVRGLSAQAIDFAVLEALSDLEHRKVSEALLTARRAARMARTESLLIQEYTSNLLLARARRHNASSHFALTILSSIEPALPLRWRRWCDTELLLAGGVGSDSMGTTRDLIGAAQTGDVARFGASASDLCRKVSGWKAMAHEVALFIAAIDPAATTEHLPELQGWLVGSNSQFPRGISAPSFGEATIALAVRPPSGVPRRVLSQGIGLIGAMGGMVRLPVEATATSRSSAAVAALVLAGDPGADVPEFFRSVYGFAFHPTKHAGTLRVLLHRVRDALGTAASVERVGERLRLVGAGQCYAPDPRCTLTVEDRVLMQVSASAIGTGARDIALGLRLPLGKVQTTLKELVESGMCFSEREGRRVIYRVEDTTVEELSVERLAQFLFAGRVTP
ncbi:MAG: hypothetical protein AAGF12_23535 [Myxococcota bacterium]